VIDLNNMAKTARSGFRQLSLMSASQKNQALEMIAGALIQQMDDIINANQNDVNHARENGLSEALIDRLLLNPQRIASIAEDVRTVISLDDPVGSIFDEKTMPNGLRVHKQRVPLGVIAVIYESRPNVTIDVSCLALKSGNAVILRGGKETWHTNRALVALVQQALENCGIPRGCVQYIDDPEHAVVTQLLQMQDDIDMLIPRGGAKLHQYCREHSKIPVITGGIGICHVFVDESANQQAAVQVIYNAKTQRPSVCNALDTLLVHEKIAKEFLPVVVDTLSRGGVTFRADNAAMHLLETVSPNVLFAGKEDFDTEWLSLVLGIKVVENIDEAIAHIQQHSTGHSDGILTNDPENASRFVQMVDSAAVYVNASTRFTDGSQLGLGAEVAISTQRLHARGPMALEALTTYKWVIQGDYHIRP